MMLTPNSVTKQDVLLHELIKSLEISIQRFNQIRRIKVSDQEIIQDVMSPDTTKKLTANQMPHYMNCWGFSDLFKDILSTQWWIQSELICLEMVRKWVFHIAIKVSTVYENYIIWWNQDTVILTNETLYKILFSEKNRSWDNIDSIETLSPDTIIQIGRESEAFMRLRVRQILRESHNPSNDTLLEQKLKLKVILPPETRNWFEENGIWLMPIEDIWTLHSSWIVTPRNNSNIMAIMEDTLHGENSVLPINPTNIQIDRAYVQWANFFSQ